LFFYLRPFIFCFRVIPVPVLLLSRSIALTLHVDGISDGDYFVSRPVFPRIPPCLDRRNYRPVRSPGFHPASLWAALRVRLYDLYFEKEKSIFYEMDTKRRLWRFYEALGRKLQNVTPAEEHIETRLWLDRVVSRGRNYVEQAGLDYDPEKNENEEIYYKLTKAEEKGMEEGRRNAGLV
jgi:hypothetical protein